MDPKILGPREFFLELKDLFRALEAQNASGGLTLQTKDALARVLSWLPHMRQTTPKKTKLPRRTA